MDPRSGSIAAFESEEDAKAAGYTVPVTDDEAARLKSLYQYGTNRKARRRALAEMRRQNRPKGKVTL